MTKPYKESIQIQHGTDEVYTIREFSEDVNEDELVWHRDKKTRKLSVLKANGWKLQMDDQLPEELKEGIEYLITRGTYHRVIKGYGKLVVRFKEI